jgi:hypothetical protein
MLSDLSHFRRLTLAVRTNKDLRREAYSMSMYVAIVLLSTLSVFNEDHPPDRGEVFLLELGTTVGLVLAHGFASWISTTIMGAPSDGVDQWDLLRVQLGGALVIAGLAMLALILTPTSIELVASRLTVAATIGALVFLESRSSNTALRAALYGFLALAAGVTIAAVKAFLVH